MPKRPRRETTVAPRRQTDHEAWWQDRRAGILIALVALALRLAHLFDFSRLPLFARPTVDVALYVDSARRLAESGVLPDVFFKPPLFPVVLGVWWRVVGEDWFWLRVPFIVLGACTAFLTWALAKRLFGATVALLAGLLYALHASAVYFDGELLEMGLVTFVQLAALGLTLHSQNTARRAPALLSGAMIGVGIVARPTFWLFALFAMWMARQRRVLWMALGLLAAVAPVTLHNAVRGRDFVVVSSNLGLNFYIGNNARADGRIVSTPEFPAEPALARREARRIAELEAGKTLKPSAVSRYWLQRGLAHAATHPLQTAELAVRKMFYLWSGTPLSDNEDLLSLPRYLRLYGWLPVGMWLLAPLGLVGWIATRGRRELAQRDLALARGYMAMQLLSIWPFFVVERFRLPWAPLLAVFAAWTLVALTTRLRSAPRRATRFVLATLAAFTLCNVPAFGVRQPPELDLDYKLAYAYHQQGRLVEAERAYRNAIARRPGGAALARNALAYLLADRGESLDEAAALARQALALDPARTPNYAETLAFVELRRKQPDAALAACRRGLAAAPATPTQALLHLRSAEAHQQLGNVADALHEARAAANLAATPDVRMQADELLKMLQSDNSAREP